MASVHIPRVLSTRGKTTMDIDRENFEKSQSASIQKAINQVECAVKEKHARIVIIGSHKEKSGATYWSIARRLPLQEHPIVAWKFCHVTHKLLRDGHPNAISDSQRYVGFIADFGKLWGHLKEGYGRLISAYAKLIIQKLLFHKKNSSIPGNLHLDDDQLDKICNHDINSYFELSVDMLDYMDDILLLQNVVFSSLDMSRANSMTSSGQCRLAPLILCIQDSCQLYDYLVKILFRLHSSTWLETRQLNSMIFLACMSFASGAMAPDGAMLLDVALPSDQIFLDVVLPDGLPPDTLSGHRERFYKQYRNLKQFYMNTQNLQYFKNLIRVPVLPDTAPNFLKASELHSHVKPMVIVSEPEPEPPEPDVQSESDMSESMVDMLVDTTSPPQEEIFSHNGAPAQPLPDERDSMIKQLMWEVNQLKRELARMKAEDQMVMESLHNRVRDLEMELNELRQIAESTTSENEILKIALKESEKNEDVSARMNTIEKIAKANEEKFTKMKDIYSKLRKEHVQLLRTHSESTKQLTIEKRMKEEFEQKHKALNEEVFLMKQEKAKTEETLVRTSSAAEQLSEIVTARDQLAKEKEDLDRRVKELEEVQKELQLQVEQKKFETERLQTDLLSTETAKSTTEQLLNKEKSELQRLRNEFESVSVGRSSVEEMLSKRLSEMDKLLEDFNVLKTEKLAKEEELAKRSADLEKLSKDLVSEQSERAAVEERFALKSVESEQLAEQLKKTTSGKADAEELVLNQKAEMVGLNESLLEMSKERAKYQQELNDKSLLVEKLKSDLELALADKVNTEKSFQQKLLANSQEMLICAVAEGEVIIRDALAQCDNPHHTTVRCTAEYLLNRVQPALTSLSSLNKSCNSYSIDKSAITDAVRTVCDFSHYLGDAIVFGFATSHSAQIEPGEELSVSCKSAGDESLALLELIKKGAFSDMPLQSKRVEDVLNRIISQSEELLPKIEDVQAEKMGDLVDLEMQETAKAIELAAARIAEMLASSREQHSGIQLEVNEKILDSCNNLMKRIRVLIEKSKVLQREIVSQGRGTSSIKDFYKKQHRWTEGLISAAKSVGFGANILVEAADKVIVGKGKFEELVVCAQEIAASTAQLVVASKVKAQRGSENLTGLSDASKGVSEATGQVIASVKSGAERVEDIDTFDFSKITLHQAKRKEMDSQVRVLELESNLDKERRKLSELRKTHYQLAGESEGWDQEEMSAEGSDF